MGSIGSVPRGQDVPCQCSVFFMFVYVPVANANHVTQSTFSVGVGYTRAPVTSTTYDVKFIPSYPRLDFPPSQLLLVGFLGASE